MTTDRQRVWSATANKLRSGFAQNEAWLARITARGDKEER
jgi:hypothetical protein